MKLSKAAKESLEARKNAILFNLKRNEKFINSPNLKEKLSESKCRLEAFKPLYNEFITCVSGLHSDKPDSSEELEVSTVEETQFEKELEDFESRYFLVLSKLNDMNKQEVAFGPVTGPRASNTLEITLPPMNLPKFKGDYHNWIYFKDKFESLFHNKPNFDNVKKLHYLKSCLQSPAADILANLETTDANYPIAWDLLKKRYENKRLIGSSLVSNILNIPKRKDQSLKSIKDLTFEFFRNVNALKALGEPVDTSSFLLLPLITTKMNSELLMKWEGTLNRDSTPTLSDLENFLNKEIDILEFSSETSSKPNNNDNNKGFNFKPNNDKQEKKLKFTYQSTSGASKCPKAKPNEEQEFKYPCYACSEQHRLYKCPAFLKMSPSSRLELVNKLGICTNCFNKKHTSNDCKSLFSCKVCQLKHNTLIHIDKAIVSASSVALPAKTNQILLATAMVEIVTPKGRFTVRCLLDGGSQSNFISKSCLQSLVGLSTKKCYIPVKGIGENPEYINSKVTTIVASKHTDYSIPIEFLVINKMPNHLPNESFDVSRWNIPDGVELADPEFYLTRPIQLIIGAEYYFDSFSPGYIKLSDSSPILQNTKFGWIISGKYSSVDNISNEQNHSFLSTCLHTQTNDTDSLLTQFRELENVNETQKPLSKLDQEVEDYYSNTVNRNESGRYSVRLPFLKDPSLLGSSSEAALKCLFSLEKRFFKDQKLKEDYKSFMSEYINLGHMRELTDEEYKIIKITPHYFMPHHAVVRSESRTTKLRVVFNASMPTSSGYSLNDLLASGPPLQNEIFSILVRFRSHKFVLVADVEKMFRQIQMQHPDYYFQLVYWREEADLPVKIYILLTVTYGTAPAPYLSIKTLHQLGVDEAKKFPLASKVLVNDFFCDDVLSGCSTVSGLKKLQVELDSLLQKGGMNLRKWCSNSAELCNSIKINDDPNYVLNFSKEGGMKTLGIYWTPSNDNFIFKINFESHIVLTKRKVISDVCRIYDPLGLLGPIIVLAKLFIRDLWLKRFEWDEKLPQVWEERWSSYIEQFSSLNESLIISRYLSPIESPIFYELHGFCDASELAYGGCVYLKSINNDGSATVSLIASKSRVAPIKTQSIPRLELCGALLLSELVLKIQTSLYNIEFKDIYLWTDSMVVLYWLSADACKWKPFVANRVAKVQTNTATCHWMHVTTDENPADRLSRGSFDISDVWMSGPLWLKENSEYNHPELSSDLEIPETKASLNKDTLSFVTTTKFNPIEILSLLKYSSWIKVYHITAYLFRFVSNCKTEKNLRNSDKLTQIEIEKAQKFIIRHAQMQMFPEEIKLLNQNKPIPSSSRILPLTPFLDSEKILRVGGRLKNSSIQFDQKHPILLRSKHPLTTLIVKYYHKLTLHAGPQSMLYSMRQRFWPIDGKNLCKKVVHECITCFRVDPKSFSYLMGNLPSERVKISKPFLCSGVDFAGPFNIRQSHARKPILVKAYACIFVCMSTKAVHIEAVSDLTADAFISCLRRFVARRGACQTLFCDNGRNFVGADSQLKDIYTNFRSKKFVDAFTSKFEGIKFQWIPARSPSMGGLWERAVRSFKHHLRRLMGNIHLTFEEISTVLAQIESQLNSRPLTPLSNDPNDLTALSPSHFLIGEQAITIPDEEVENDPFHLLDKWQKVQKIYQQFWRRWSTEYLNQLQSRAKWKMSDSPPPKIGQLVLLKEDNTTPLHWVMARITKLHPGNDKIVRVATVKTANGDTRRAITKLCPLPINYDLPDVSQHSDKMSPNQLPKDDISLTTLPLTDE